VDLPEALAGHASYHGWLTSQEGYGGQISFYGFLPPRAQGDGAPYAGPYEGLLEALNVTLYSHQREALEAVGAGENVVVATPTASGKSLAYQLPTLHAVGRGGTAMYLFPTKALAHDQLGKLRGLAACLGLEGTIASFDGDTPTDARRGVREGAGVVLTNPDMLHYGILPHHARWARFLGSLELLVLDELHAYRWRMFATCVPITPR